MILFYNFLELHDVTQRSLLAIFYSCLMLTDPRPTQKDLPKMLVRIIQSFELGIIGLGSDGDKIWLHPVQNQEFFSFMMQRFQKNKPLEKRVRQFLTSIKLSKEQIEKEMC